MKSVEFGLAAAPAVRRAGLVVEPQHERAARRDGVRLAGGQRERRGAVVDQRVVRQVDRGVGGVGDLEHLEVVLRAGALDATRVRERVGAVVRQDLRDEELGRRGWRGRRCRVELLVPHGARVGLLLGGEHALDRAAVGRDDVLDRPVDTLVAGGPADLGDVGGRAGLRAADPHRAAAVVETVLPGQHGEVEGPLPPETGVEVTEVLLGDRGIAGEPAVARPQHERPAGRATVTPSSWVRVFCVAAAQVDHGVAGVCEVDRGVGGVAHLDELEGVDGRPVGCLPVARVDVDLRDHQRGQLACGLRRRGTSRRGSRPRGRPSVARLRTGRRRDLADGMVAPHRWRVNRCRYGR